MIHSARWLSLRENFIRSLPEGRLGQVAALGLLALILALLWSLVFGPLLSTYAQRTDALTLQRQLAEHMAALVHAVPRLEQEKAALPVKTDFLVAGNTVAIASANLEDNLQKAAASVHATIVSVENTPISTSDPSSRIGVHIVLDATFDSLVRLVALLKQSSPVVAMDDIHIGVSDDSDNPASAMRIDMTVYAFRHDGPDLPSIREKTGP